jgi:hypothetical protein
MFDSNVNGTPFPGGRLVGTFRFDAPTVVLPPAPEGGATGAFFNAPFVFSGQVTGFAHADVERRVSLFEVSLVGQGTLTLSFDDFFNGMYSTVEERFTFTATAVPAPVPEPTTMLLLVTGLAIGARWRRRKYSATHRGRRVDTPKEVVTCTCGLSFSSASCAA